MPQVAYGKLALQHALGIEDADAWLRDQLAHGDDLLALTAKVREAIGAPISMETIRRWVRAAGA